jgi:MFS family permease
MDMLRLTLAQTFAAMRYRNYRLWFIGQLVSLVGTAMQSTAQGYLIYTLTGSVAYLGYVGFISGLPSLVLILYGGVIADRVHRRNLLIITQSAMMVLAFILAGLDFFNVVQPWHILALAFLLGIANAFDAPARQSFVLEMVNREDMTNAIALNGTMYNLGSIVGPAAAGLAYTLIGPAWCFTLNGISFIAVIIALAMMRITFNPPPFQRISVITAIREGLGYVRTERLVATLSVTTFVMNVFGFGLIVLIPAWAVSVLKGNAATNGLLLSSRALGAVIGGLVIASIAGHGKRGRLWSTSSFLLPLVMVGFALTRWQPLSYFFLAGMGFFLISIMNTNNAMVQSRVPDELRGRVMGIYSLMFMGGGPIGSLLVGEVASWISEPTTALLCAGALVLFAVFILLRRPEVRAMD